MNCLKCKHKFGALKKLSKAKLNKNQNLRCNTCGYCIQKEGEEYKTCLSCSEFVSCNECLLCNNGHYLNRVFYLNQLNSGYMTGYGCDLCGMSFSKFGDLGVWHCPSCHFDVCPTCIP
jgi:DNA-directed RNA polymerase subunit RPC12/RpoP